MYLLKPLQRTARPIDHTSLLGKSAFLISEYFFQRWRVEQEFALAPRIFAFRFLVTELCHCLDCNEH